MTDHRMLLVHAHPDDECINNGATMARYVDEGVGEDLEHERRRIAQHRPRVVLVVVLPRQSLALDVGLEAVGAQPGDDRPRLVLVEEDRPHGGHSPPRPLASVGG